MGSKGYERTWRATVIRGAGDMCEEGRWRGRGGGQGCALCAKLWVMGVEYKGRSRGSGGDGGKRKTGRGRRGR